MKNEITEKEQLKANARKLFLNGTKVPQISEELSISKTTLYSWIRKEQWNEVLTDASSLFVAHKRLQYLLAKPTKTSLELDEFEKICNVIDRLEKIEERKIKAAAKAKAIEAGEYSEKGKRRKKGGNKQNDLSEIDLSTVEEKVTTGLKAYQMEMWAIRHHRNRLVLKSRQIGMTWYFAREAFADLLLTGKNKIFISASLKQVAVFRNYIKGFCREWFDVELKGKEEVCIKTPHGEAYLIFCSTNISTAQSFNGDLYFDEFFWIPKFASLKTTAGGMATHKQFTKTYFSTPSSKAHSAYPFWSGKDFIDKERKKGNGLIKWPSDKKLRKGCVCPDKMFRVIITLDDAETKGADFFDREQLELEHTDYEFALLYLCRFMDDSASMFHFNELEDCMVNASNWKDFDLTKNKPFGNKPVWIGYDPARSCDGACIVVVAPPEKVKGKFRVLERITLNNVRWDKQAEAIKTLTENYNVEYIGIDVTGNGSAVAEAVEKFFPAVTKLFYNIELRTHGTKS
ncbi:terminase family protein [Lentisphaerota bacterium WC36G]|nr:terminase family protein [Lentisphaerae bacterium WC36]